MFFPEHYTSRSQDLPVAMYDAGQFYWATANSCIIPPKGFHDKSTVITIPSWRAQDIDTFEDWKRAEVIFQMMQGRIEIQ
jgi:N-acylneuraminate cytidylyltransferase